MERRKNTRPDTEQIYAEEFGVLDHARSICQRTDTDPDRLQQEYTRLTNQFGRLLRDTVKLTRIGDASQRKLLQAYDQIEQQKAALQKAHLELTDAHRLLERAARTDHLTGVANRRGLVSWLQEAEHGLDRNGQPFALVLCDIDDFKQVNDRHGHEHGDRVLVEVARLLQDGLGEGSRLGRWGGEEFLVLLPGRDLAEAVAVAENLRAVVNNAHFGCNGRALLVTLTFGVTACHTPVGLDRLLQRADEALYKGKQTGKNLVVIAEPFLEGSEP